MLVPAFRQHNQPVCAIAGRFVNDGTILRLGRFADRLEVVVEVASPSHSLERNTGISAISIVFDDVRSVSMLHPCGMLFSALLEWPAEPPLRRFEFANQFQPGDDWDPYLAESLLEIVASRVEIVGLP